MDKIMDLMNNLGNLEKFVPKLDTLMGWVQWLISLSVRVGSVCILVLGLIYLFIPPKEANRVAGYRTYFGMGSILAWRFTQRVAGLLMSVFGLILTIIAFVTVAKFRGLDTSEMTDLAFRCIKGQLICVLIIWIFMFVLTTVMFDRHGYRRFRFQTNTILDKFFFLDLEDMDPPAEDGYDEETCGTEEEYAGNQEDDAGMEEYPTEEPYAPEYAVYEDPVEEYQDYELQGEGPITAEDIEIEDLEA